MPAAYTLGASNTPIGPEVRSTPVRSPRARGPKPKRGLATLFTMKLGSDTRLLLAKLQGLWQDKAGLSYTPSVAEVIRLALEIADAAESGRKANVPWRAGNTWGTVMPATPGPRERGAAAAVAPAAAVPVERPPKPARVVSPRPAPEVVVKPETAPKPVKPKKPAAPKKPAVEQQAPELEETAAELSLRKSSLQAPPRFVLKSFIGREKSEFLQSSSPPPSAEI